MINFKQDKQKLQTLTDKQLIGVGAASRVYKLELNNKQNVAVKKIQLFGKNQFERLNSIQEALILYCQTEQGIITCYDCFYDPNDDVLYLLLEYVQKDLASILDEHKNKKTPIKEAFMWKLIVDITQSLVNLHGQGIIHRDLKPSNILVKQGKNIIADFNISTIRSQNQERSFNGSPFYLSPQYYLSKKQTEKDDIWAFGMVLYELCCLSNPHSSKQLMEIEQSLKSNHLNFDPIPSFYSLCLKNLIYSMLTLSTVQRPSAKTILQYCSICGNQVSNSRPVKKNYIKEFLSSMSLNFERNESCLIDVFHEYDLFTQKRELSMLQELKISNISTKIQKENQGPANKIKKLKRLLPKEPKIELIR